MHLPKIEFSGWSPWSKRNDFDGVNLPGVYLLAHFDDPPVDPVNPKAKEIIYIGETGKRTFIKRWGEFQNVAFGNKENHSGGKTYKGLFGNSRVNNLYISAMPVSELSIELRPLFIKYVERKLILGYALEHGDKPQCNRE